MNLSRCSNTAERIQQMINYAFVFSFQVEFVAGGSAQNTVRLVSRLTKKVGSEDKHLRSFVVGKIGCDRMGEILQNLLLQDGVETRLVLCTERFK